MPDRRRPGSDGSERDIWFVPGDGGAYAPVNRKGCIVFAVTAAWILVCGSVGMLAFLCTMNPWCFAGMFGAVVPALLLMARTVRRHS